MRRMAMVAAAAAMATAGPARAEMVEFGEGDVYCLEYRLSDHTCESRGTLVSREGDRGRTREEGFITDFAEPLGVVVEASLRFGERRNCMVAGSTTTTILPPDHPMAGLAHSVFAGTIQEMAREGYCVSYLRCEDDYFTVAYIGDERFPDLDARFALFRAGDPAIATLELRPVDTEGGMEPTVVPPECLPML